MAVQAMAAVMTYSQNIWGEKFLLLLIADKVNWPDAMAEISETDLAHEAGRTPRHLRTHIHNLEDSGELICHRRPGLRTIFQIPQFPDEPDRKATEERRRNRQKQSYDARLRRKRDARASGARADAGPGSDTATEATKE